MRNNVPLMDDSWRERFNRRYAELHREEGLTQEALAVAVGVTQSTIAHWKNGRRTPDSLSQFEKLAHALGWHPAYLLYGVTASFTGIASEHKAFYEDFRRLNERQQDWMRSHMEHIQAASNGEMKRSSKKKPAAKRKVARSPQARAS